MGPQPWPRHLYPQAPYSPLYVFFSLNISWHLKILACIFHVVWWGIISGRKRGCQEHTDHLPSLASFFLIRHPKNKLNGELSITFGPMVPCFCHVFLCSETQKPSECILCVMVTHSPPCPPLVPPAAAQTRKESFPFTARFTLQA